MRTATDNSTRNYKKLVKAIQELSLASDLEHVMSIVRHVARDLTGADGCTFILRKEDMCYYMDEDAIEPLWKGQAFPSDSCISGWAMIHKQRVIIEDIYNDDRIPLELYRPTFIKSLVMMPIRSLEPIGAIGSYWAKTHTPNEEELEMLQSLADVTAVSLENIRINSELEQRVATRTRDLENVNKELELFSYSVSHDLRAPLRGINGFSTVLLEEHSNNLSEEGKRIVSRILANVKKMNELIEDLNDLFRTGKRELQGVPILMKSMVIAVCDELKESEGKASLRFKIGELPDTIGDTVLIKQALLNLIGNAIKYSAKRAEPLVEIGCRVENKRKIYYVRDNGVGFDMKYYENMFGIFQRFHSQKEFEGTGIGLAIVHKIISRHGGEIWAESKVGEGATFYFTLP